MQYNQIYKTNNVWGSKPNELLQKVYNQVETGSEFLDLGCGQGRDSLFMLRNGFKVTAVDNAQQGIESIKAKIQENNLSVDGINLLCEDLGAFSIQKDKFSIINAFNSLQFLPKKVALGLIEIITESLRGGGYVIVSCFTVNDPLYQNTTADSRCFFEPQELKNLFSDFKIVSYEEEEVADNGHPGSPEPHTHHIAKLIAQKIISD